MNGLSDRNIVQLIMKLDIKGEGAISIKFERIGEKDQILLVVNPSVRHILIYQLSGLENHLFEAMINAMIFHQMLLNSILWVCKERFYFMEDIVEASALNMSVVWSNQEMLGNYVKYVEEADVTLEEIKEIFNHHDTNYRSLIANESPLSIGGGVRHFQQLDEGMKYYFKHLVEDFIVKVLTISKICREETDSLGYADYINRLLNNDKNRRVFNTLCFKVELFQADMVYTEINQSFASRPLQEKANLTEHIFMLER